MGRKKRAPGEYGTDDANQIWYCLNICEIPKERCYGECWSSPYKEVRDMMKEEAKKAREEYEKEHGTC